MLSGLRPVPSSRALPGLLAGAALQQEQRNYSMGALAPPVWSRKAKEPVKLYEEVRGKRAVSQTKPQQLPSVV